MPKISFDPKTLGVVIDPELADMRDPVNNGAFVPLVLTQPGIEALIQVLRLPNIEMEIRLRREQARTRSRPTEDIDPADR